MPLESIHWQCLFTSRSCGRQRSNKARVCSRSSGSDAWCCFPSSKHPCVSKRLATGKTAVAGAEADEDGWVWGTGGQESMHPFWAVRRATAQQLERENLAKLGTSAPEADPQSRLSFNCGFVKVSHTCVDIAVLGDTPLGRSRILEIPWLTNTRALRAGEELCLEIPEIVKEKSGQKRGWRAVLRNEELSKKSRTEHPGSRM